MTARYGRVCACWRPGRVRPKKENPARRRGSQIWIWPLRLERLPFPTLVYPAVSREIRQVRRPPESPVACLRRNTWPVDSIPGLFDPAARGRWGSEYQGQPEDWSGTFMFRLEPEGSWIPAIRRVRRPSAFHSRLAHLSVDRPLRRAVVASLSPDVSSRFATGLVEPFFNDALLRRRLRPDRGTSVAGRRRSSPRLRAGASEEAGGTKPCTRLRLPLSHRAAVTPTLAGVLVWALA
jgi:hypothetical protein